MITPEVGSSEVQPDSQHVWYASYGSNMHRDRFMRYIEGGQAPGSAVAHEGSSDPTPPTATEAFHLPQDLYFAGESWHWLDDNGNKMGAGFTTLDNREDSALGVAYRITRKQFADVVAQENGLKVGSLPDIDLDRVKDHGHIELFPGQFYSTIQWNGDIEGEPILGFTGPERPFNKPADGYLWVIGRGLMIAHDMREEQAAAYLVSKPGAAGHFKVTDLANILAGEQPKPKNVPKH